MASVAVPDFPEGPSLEAPKISRLNKTTLHIKTTHDRTSLAEVGRSLICDRISLWGPMVVVVSL